MKRYPVQGMNYKVTRNGEQTGKWFDTPAEAWVWIDSQVKIEIGMGYPRVSKYMAYYNPTGSPTNRHGAPVYGLSE